MHNTGNPLGSKDILDLYDNSEVVDNFVNSQQDEVPDRFGTKRLTLAGLIKRSMALRNEINDFSGALTFKPEWSDVPMNVSEGVGGEGGALNLQAEALGNRSEINKITSREALRRTYQEVGLNLVEGSFEQGGTLVTPSDVLLEEKTGEVYNWAGTLPKTVDKGSLPTSAIEWKPRSDDTVINVKRFGAIGTWNPETADGPDDTDALQRAIDYCVSLGTRRRGGLRGILVPPGHYKYTALKIPSEIDFGLTIFSTSPNDTYLWADSGIAGPAIDCESEYTRFTNITFVGDLTDKNGNDSTKWRAVGFKGKLGWNYADIDVRFDNCNMIFWKVFSEIHGRGCVFNSCDVGFVLNLINIVADPTTIFIPDTNFQNFRTGMRHYTIRDTRFDVVSVIIDITGNGEQKDYINDITIVGNDFAQCDILIRGTDAIIRQAIISGNNSIFSFKTGVIQVKSAKGLNINNSIFSKGYDDGLEIMEKDTILSLIRATGWLDGIIVNSIILRNLSGNLIQAGSISNNVTISMSHFPNAWSVPYGSNHFVYYSPTHCEGLTIIGNSFSSSSINGLYYYFDNSTQTVTRTKVFGNTAPFKWQEHRLRFAPRVLINGSPTAGAGTTFGRYEVKENRVYVSFMITITLPEISGNISVSLPGVDPIPEDVVQTGSYAGGGSLYKHSGFNKLNGSMGPLVVNPTTKECELWKTVDMVMSRITAADKVGTVTLYGSYDYKI